MAKLLSPKEALEEARRKWDTENPDPTADQTLATIAAFLMESDVGTEVAIRSTYGGILTFSFTTIREVGSGTRRHYIYTVHAADYGGPAWYRKTGVNAKSPGGQARLVQLTPLIRDFMQSHPMGKAGYSKFLPSEIPKIGYP